MTSPAKTTSDQKETNDQQSAVKTVKADQAVDTNTGTGQLARTGTDSLVIAALALAFAVVGALALVAARKRSVR